MVSLNLQQHKTSLIPLNSPTKTFVGIMAMVYKRAGD